MLTLKLFVATLNKKNQLILRFKFEKKRIILVRVLTFEEFLNKHLNITRKKIGH